MRVKIKKLQERIGVRIFVTGLWFILRFVIVLCLFI